MSITLKLLEGFQEITQADIDAACPTKKVAENEEVIGILTEDHKRLFTLLDKISDEHRDFHETLDIENLTDEIAERHYFLKHKQDSLKKLFWNEIELTYKYPGSLGIRENWQLVKIGVGKIDMDEVMISVFGFAGNPFDIFRVR